MKLFVRKSRTGLCIGRPCLENGLRPTIKCQPTTIGMCMCAPVCRASWAALEKAQNDGKAKYIGVSNYPAEILLEMKEYAEIMPAVNQVLGCSLVTSS